MAAAPGTLLRVIARVLAAAVTIVAGHCAGGKQVSLLVPRAAGLQGRNATLSFAVARPPPVLFPPPCPLATESPHPPVPTSPALMSLTFTIPLVLGELEARAAFTGNAPLGSLPADVGTAVVLVHAVHPF